MSHKNLLTLLCAVEKIHLSSMAGEGKAEEEQKKEEDPFKKSIVEQSKAENEEGEQKEEKVVHKSKFNEKDEY